MMFLTTRRMRTPRAGRSRNKALGVALGIGNNGRDDQERYNVNPARQTSPINSTHVSILAI